MSHSKSGSTESFGSMGEKAPRYQVQRNLFKRDPTFLNRLYLETYIAHSDKTPFPFFKLEDLLEKCLNEKAVKITTENILLSFLSQRTDWTDATFYINPQHILNTFLNLY